MTTPESKERLKKLLEPFPLDAIEWKPGATTRDKDRALALAYADSRLYFERLNQTFGMNWSDEYDVIVAGDRVIIKCTLHIENSTRCDVGEEALYSGRDNDINKNAITTASAQAFKRACTKFGLGAFLYSVPQEWAEYDKQKRRFTDRGFAYLQGALAHHLGLGDKPAKDVAPKEGEAPTDDINGRLTRPMTATQVKAAIELKSIQGSQATASEKQAGAVASLFQKAFEEEDDPASFYHKSLEWLTGVSSAKDLTKAQASAIMDWLKADKDSWDLHMAAPDEAARVFRQALVDEGQLELELS